MVVHCLLLGSIFKGFCLQMSSGLNLEWLGLWECCLPQQHPDPEEVQYAGGHIIPLTYRDAVAVRHGPSGHRQGRTQTGHIVTARACNGSDGGPLSFNKSWCSSRLRDTT